MHRKSTERWLVPVAAIIVAVVFAAILGIEPRLVVLLVVLLLVGIFFMHASGMSGNP